MKGLEVEIEWPRQLRGLCQWFRWGGGGAVDDKVG